MCVNAAFVESTLRLKQSAQQVNSTGRRKFFQFSNPAGNFQCWVCFSQTLGIVCPTEGLRAFILNKRTAETQSAEVPLLLHYCSVPVWIIQKMLHGGVVFCHGCNWNGVVHSILNSKWWHLNNMLCLSYTACPAEACFYEVNVVRCVNECMLYVWLWECVTACALVHM